MNGDDVADAIMDSESPSGPVLIHVVDRDREYWLEVLEVRPTTLIDTGWVNGNVIETKPIAEGVRAQKEVFTPRPYFQTPFLPPPASPVDLPEEFKNPEPDPLQPLIGKQITMRVDHLVIVDPAPEGALTGIIHMPLQDHLFVNPHMGHPKPEPVLPDDLSEPHYYWTYENAPEFQTPGASGTPVTLDKEEQDDLER